MWYNRAMEKVILCVQSVGKALARAEKIVEGMPEIRRRAYETARSEDVRRQYLAAAGALARAVEARGLAADFFYLPDGRPAVKGAHIGIAHTPNMAICAIADAPVGVDIENADRAIRPQAARKILAPGESLQNGRTLTDVWVDKEAYLKLTGAGLAGGMSRYRVAGDAVFDAQGNPAAYLARPALEGYRISICCAEKFCVEVL